MSEIQNIEELIIRYFQQDITEDDLRLLDTWLDEKPENKALFFEMKEVSDSGHSSLFLDERRNEASWKRMEERLSINGSRSILPEFGKKKVWLPYFRYVAIIVLAVGLGWGMNEFYKTGRLFYLVKSEIIYNEIHVEKGGRANTLLLSDGSKVVLNAATTLRYPSNFCSSERRVFLDGEAYFEVSKNEEKPFIIQLKRQEIKVLGTTFNVDAYAGEEQSTVTLLTGCIGLDAYNDKGEKMSSMFLKPNQVAHSDNQTGSVSIQNTDATLACAWVKGEYKFKDETLSSIAKRLEYYYGVNICVEDESLKQVKYTGTFSLDQDIRDVLQIIDYEKRLIVRIEKKNIFLTRK